MLMTCRTDTVSICSPVARSTRVNGHKARSTVGASTLWTTVRNMSTLASVPCVVTACSMLPSDLNRLPAVQQVSNS